MFVTSKGLKSLVVIVLLLSGISSLTPQVFAETLKQQIEAAKEKQQDLKQEKSNINHDIQHKQNSITAIQQDQAAIEAEIKRIDMAVADTKTKITTKEKEIIQTKADIDLLNIEIAELHASIEKRDEVLKNRVRVVQQNGGVISYLDVLLGAENFSDFVDRVGAVSVIVNQDREILDKHIKDKAALETKKQEVLSLLQSLETQRKELEGLQEKLEADREIKDRIAAQLKEREDQIEEEKIALEEEREILAKQEQAMKRLVKQLEEQERRRQEAIKRGEKPPASDGTFTRPSDGRLSSNYGMRWGKLHAGVDIAKKGDVPVVAAASGIVFKSYYSSSYGNVIFIAHSINGQSYTTVYAHLESRSVSEGDAVSKGQKIGMMGNSGRSFGQHLHFEIHKGEWNVNKTNSVDPRKYINF